jgi:hypothetical protein
MEYALLIYRREDGYDHLGDHEHEALMDEYDALAEDPRVLASAGLESVELATTVRDAGGHVLVTDGPFANTREVFAGYYVLKAEDLDEAIAFARLVPVLRLGGAVEVRPIFRRQR